MLLNSGKEQRISEIKRYVGGSRLHIAVCSLGVNRPGNGGSASITKQHEAGEKRKRISHDKFSCLKCLFPEGYHMLVEKAKRSKNVR